MNTTHHNLAVAALLWCALMAGASAARADLIGHWAFDEGSGAVAGDSSGYGSTGTLVNGPAWTTDAPVGTAAMTFDGQNDYVNVGNQAILNVTQAITISAWVNPDTLSTVARTRWPIGARATGCSSRRTRSSVSCATTSTIPVGDSA